MKILILDDNYVLVSFLRMELDKIGHTTFGVRTISDAKKIVEENEIDVALVDLSLEGESGEDFVVYLKEHKPLIYIIIVSGLHYYTLSKIANKYGVATLQKVIDFNKLLELLENKDAG